MRAVATILIVALFGSSASAIEGPLPDPVQTEITTETETTIEQHPIVRRQVITTYHVPVLTVPIPRMMHVRGGVFLGHPVSPWYGYPIRPMRARRIMRRMGYPVGVVIY